MTDTAVDAHSDVVMACSFDKPLGHIRMDAETIPVNHTNPMAAGRVAIVVATHKYCFPLERCISSHVNLLPSAADFIFVDNGSGGEMTAWAKEKYPQITVITREENGYFCGGYNSGMQHAIDHNYEFVLIVNADTEVCNSGYVADLVAAAADHPQAAFLGPTVFLREEGHVQNTILRYPWFGRHLMHWLTSGFYRSNRSARAHQNLPVDFLNGVCVLCRVSALREIGLLDEDMGGYVEDTDWSWRARKRDWHSRYVPVHSIIHHQAEDEYEQYSVKTFMLRRNHVYWHMKNGHRVQAWLFAVMPLLVGTVRTIRERISGNNPQQHQKAMQLFRQVSRKILSREPLGEWFGPPLGQAANE